MRALLSFLAICLFPFAAVAAPAGSWTCKTHSEDQGADLTMQVAFVGGRLVETFVNGDRRVVPDPAISDDYVFWTTARGLPVDFYPNEGKLETGRGGPIHNTYTCTRQP